MITTYDVFVKPTMGMGCSKRIGVDLAKQGHKKAFMIYDKGMWDFGIAEPIIRNLKAAGMEVVTFDGVLPDPPDEMVEEAAEQAILLRAYGADEIVYDIQELDEAYQSNDTIVYVEDGIVKVKPY